MQSLMIEILNRLLLLFILIAPNVYLILIFLRTKKDLKTLLIPTLCLSLLTIIFLNKLIFTGQTLSAQDFNNIQIPFFHFFKESVVNYFEPPFWNSRFGGGFDAFSNPISAYFSPFNFLFLIFSNVYSAANVFIFFQLFLISLFSLLLFKELKFNNYLSFFGAVIFTFNGFVTMRLSPGVGIEYLYSYKWIPLIMYFTLVYLREHKLYDLALLSVSLAFTLEGNLNIAISIWAFWALFLLFMSKNFFREIRHYILIPLLALLIFSIKIIPFLDLMKNSTGRISNYAVGWRLNKIYIDEFLTYFPPIRHIFGAALFTPGVIAITFFFICFVSIVYSIFAKRNVQKLFVFSICSIVIGFIINTYNPISDFLFSLPFFNRITIVPAFMVFIFIPVYILSVYGLEICANYLLNIRFLKNFKNFAEVGIAGVSLLVFAEILTGPSTFGNNTYSFNFSKMNKEEVYKVPPYNTLRNLNPGVFAFIDSSDTFLYPYAISVSNLYTLNNFKYFYSPATKKNLIKEGDFKEITDRSDFVISTKPLDEKEITLISEVGTAEIFSEFQSHSILDKKYDYLELQAKNDWNELMYIYAVEKNDFQKPYFKRLENHPTKFTISNADDYMDNNEIKTSVRYSKWWKSFDDKKAVLKEDDFGFMIISEIGESDRVELFYLNPYIYIGFLLSLMGFLIVFRLSRSHRSDVKITDPSHT